MTRLFLLAVMLQIPPIVWLTFLSWLSSLMHSSLFCSRAISRLFSLESFFSPEEARDEACSFRSNREAWGRGKARLNQRALIEQSTSECRRSGLGGVVGVANEKQEETLVTSCHTPWVHWNNLSTNTCKYADWNHSQPVSSQFQHQEARRAKTNCHVTVFFLFKTHICIQTRNQKDFIQSDQIGSNKLDLVSETKTFKETVHSNLKSHLSSRHSKLYVCLYLV